MRMPLFVKFFLMSALAMAFMVRPVYAEQMYASTDNEMDRAQLVSQQINLLKNRLSQSKAELAALQIEHDKEISSTLIEHASKNLLEKASLDITVSKSNLDSISMELSDSQQTILWLEKNCQEIESQLNVLNIFGIKIARHEIANIGELKSDLVYLRKLLNLEKSRVKYLSDLQTTAKSALAFKKERHARINKLLKSRNLLFLKQQQMKDELAFQEQQNNWLQQLNILYARLSKVDPVTSRDEYTALEREIFYTNEISNEAYFQSLIARYKDQIQQMRLVVNRGNSISLLNEVGNQVQIISKQIDRLDDALKSRIVVLKKHIGYLTPRQDKVLPLREYIAKLSSIANRYETEKAILKDLDNSILDLRVSLDTSLQVELASRQGMFSLGPKVLLDLGKEMLLIPTLTFQVMKSLSVTSIKAFRASSGLSWSLFAFFEAVGFFCCFFFYKILVMVLERPLAWRDKLSAKWLSLQWLRRNFIDVMLIANLFGIFMFFGVPLQNYLFMIYLSIVWLVFKSIMTIARLSLVETTHDTSGHDMRLYRRLKWMIVAAGVITAATVFVHQLPLIYEVKAMCDWLFMFQVMIVSLVLLRSWSVIPNLILTHIETQHPYLQRSVSLICILIPLLMFGNSVMGLIGFVNLIMTVSWYETVFLLVLIGYLILRGLLSDGMDMVSRLTIQYVHNGWLWTEAFLKPIDKILRITLFLSSWAVLFLFYGWDKQSPIVERLTRLLHYELAHVLNTTITPVNILALFVVISVFYWTAKWTREFVYRMLAARTADMGIRNSLAVLSQYSVVVLGAFICLRVLGIDLHALTVVAGMFAFGIGLGLRDLANNFACGFLILLERPLRVGDIVDIGGVEGEVVHVGGRAITVRTWDHMELMVPNTEIFNKSFTNWTAKDNIVRSVTHIQIGRYDNPHDVGLIIHNVLINHKEVLKDPVPEVFLQEMNDTRMEFELRYFVNIRMVKSRTSVRSAVLMKIWDEFGKHGIKPPYPQHEIFLRGDMHMPKVNSLPIRE